MFRLLELESPAPHRPKQGTRLLSLGLKPRVLRRGSDKDPLYKGFAVHQQAFQWHEDCFQLPEGAVALAHHTQGFTQAFRYGQHAYGLQYHIELTENMLDVWLLHDPPMKKEFIDTYGLEEFRRTEREAADLFPIYAHHSIIMLKNFFSLSAVI